ncbi:MAG TPA: hypothetical protein VLL54_08115 [Pyrinomonadaceae bacterium]|nr:hypothetical protein [Pyrinomonadaceae bacterium]
MPTYLRQVALPGTLALTLVLIATGFAPAANAAKRNARKFKLVAHSCESGCSDSYESPDGKPISFVYACYTDTAADARAEIQRMVAEGTVLSRSRRIGKGKRSERIVMLHPLADGKRSATIFWYRKGDICFSYIEAESLALALEFERSKTAVEPLSSYVRGAKG